VQQRAPFGGAGETVGGQQRQGLAMGQAVPLDAFQKRLLVVVGEGTERVSERRSDAPASQSALGQRGQARCDVHSPCHPLPVAPQEARDGRGAQPLLVAQGTDHAPLVQGGEGTGGRVGREQEALVLFGPAGSLQEHGDQRASAVPPGLQTLEAVQYFVVSVRQRDDADRQGRQVLRHLTGATGSERSVAGPQAIGRQEAQRACGRWGWAAIRLRLWARATDLSHGCRPRRAAQRASRSAGRWARGRGRRGRAAAGGSATARGRR
jgi:hypothetical protein